MSNDLNKYMSPQEIAAMAQIAGIEDPMTRMNTFSGLQNFANQMPRMGAIQPRDNGRVVGRTSAMEGLGQLGSQLAGAYMNKQLNNEYGSIMDKNNAQRMKVAEMVIDALRRQQPNAATPATPPTANSSVAQSFPIAPQTTAATMPLYQYTPHDFDQGY